MAESAPSAIEIQGLSKSYGMIHALRDLSLVVRQGEVFGFLGPNGAGKTTTIRILLDLVRPSAGVARVFGKDCRRQGLEVRRSLGYLPGEPGLYADMTGDEVLDLFARMQGGASDPAVRSSLLERFRLGRADLRRRIRDYSTGTKRKLGLVQAFQADPPLLILDEPTEGLDPLMQEAVYTLLGELRSRGRTIFLSSHILSEVDRLCDRIAVVREGRLVLLSTVNELRHMAPRRVRVAFDSDVGRCPAASSAYEVLGVSVREWRLAVPGQMRELLREIAPLPVVDIQVEKAGLEDILPRFYRERDE